MRHQSCALQKKNHIIYHNTEQLKRCLINSLIFFGAVHCLRLHVYASLAIFDSALPPGKITTRPPTIHPQSLWSGFGWWRGARRGVSGVEEAQEAITLMSDLGIICALFRYLLRPNDGADMMPYSRDNLHPRSVCFRLPFRYKPLRSVGNRACHHCGFSRGRFFSAVIVLIFYDIYVCFELWILWIFLSIFSYIIKLIVQIKFLKNFLIKILHLSETIFFLNCNWKLFQCFRNRVYFSWCISCY